MENLATKTNEELRAVIEQGKQAEQEIGRRHADKAKEIEERCQAIHRGEFDKRFTDDELVYAAGARCECGAGYAYPKSSGMRGRWTCSSVLKAEEKALPPTMHSEDLPFVFYEVKSENQPSANGATTRPKHERA